MMNEPSAISIASMMRTRLRMSPTLIGWLGDMEITCVSKPLLLNGPVTTLNGMIFDIR